MPELTSPRSSPVALVTGATSGCGRATAIRLAGEGFEVIVHGRNDQRGAATVRAIEDAGGTASSLGADLGDAEAVKALAGQVGHVEVLVGAFAPATARRGHGSIISVDSMAGHVGLAGGAAYGATKAALTAMSRASAAQFRPAGVRVTTVAPGPVHTDGANPELIEHMPQRCWVAAPRPRRSPR